MSTRNTRNARRRRCPTGKQRHSDREGAARHLRSHFRATGEWLQVYCCSRCGGGWHIGHAPNIKPLPQFPPYEEWRKTLHEAQEKNTEENAGKDKQI